MQNKEQKNKCLYIDHSPVWGGDGFFCQSCFIEFIPKINEVENPCKGGINIPSPEEVKVEKNDGLETRGLTENEEARAIIDQMRKVESPQQEDWRTRFKIFYNDNEVGGSSRWMVRPQAVESFLATEISEARYGGFQDGERAEQELTKSRLPKKVAEARASERNLIKEKIRKEMWILDKNTPKPVRPLVKDHNKALSQLLNELEKEE